MDEKVELGRRMNFVPPQPEDESDSDFEEHEEIYTPRTSINGNGHSDLPPTYEESEALARSRTGRPTQGVENHGEVIEFRKEITLDPPVQAPEHSDEKQPASAPPSPGPRASGLLNEALRFTENPPPTAERQALRLPIAVPSFAGQPSPVKFARFYAPALYPQSISDSEFIEFIDGLNNLAIASGFSTSTYHSRNALSPYEVSREDESVQTNDLVSAYIALSNSHFFNPRGLQVQLADLSELADILQISNPAIRQTILGEVLRMARTGIEVPAAANGAAHQAATALVPYIETLTTAVPEPRKNQEALLAVASRFAALSIATQDMTSPPDLDRHDTSSSNTSFSGPFRSKTWDEWGDDVGKFWGDWGEKQGRFWGQWGEDQGRKWGKWGEDLGRKVEKMASGPPTWAAGPSNRSCPSQSRAQYGPQRGPGGFVSPFGPPGPGWPGHHGPRGGMGARSRTMPWMPPGVSLPFQMPAHHGAPHIPPPPPGPHGMSMPHIPPHLPMPHGGAVPHMPPMPGAFPTPPQAFPPFMHAGPGFSVHQPPPPEEGPHRTRDDDDQGDDDDDEDFADIADTLSLSSVSTSSTSDTETTFGQNDNPHNQSEVVYAQKAEAIERMAAEALAKNQKSATEIELERAKAFMDLEFEYSRNEMRRNHYAQKRELKKNIRAWKKSVRKDFKTSKSMDKAQRKEWKRARKDEWKAFKAQMKAQHKAMKEETRAAKKEMKEAARAAKKEGKKKDWEGKRAEWEDRRREWGERRGGGRRRGGRRGGGSRGCGGSMDTLEDDMETQAREMLWIVVTKFEG